MVRKALFAILLLCSAPLWAGTYYIDFVNGSDSYDGSSKTFVSGTVGPWKHAPGMNGATGNVASHVVAAGDSFIFKAGVTWDYTTLPWDGPGSGTSSTTAYGCNGGVAGGGCIYFGVDHTWFDSTGCSNAGYANTALCRPIMDSGGWSALNTSCHVDANNSASTHHLDFHGLSYFIIDGFDFRNMCSSTGNEGLFGNGAYILVNSSTYYTIENSYFHKALFPSTLGPNPGGSTQPPGDYWRGIIGTTVSCTTSPDTAEAHDNVFDSGDATNANLGPGYYSGSGIYGGPNNVYRNVFANVPQAIDPACWGTIHDNLFKNTGSQSIGWISSGGGVHPHPYNATAMSPTQSYEYNNVFDTIMIGRPNIAGIMSTGKSFFIFNDVVTNVNSPSSWGEPWTVVNTAGNGYLFNITCEGGLDAGPPSGGCYQIGSGVWNVFNMHFISSAPLISGTPPYLIYGTPVSMGTTDIVVQTKSVANGQGYSYGQTYEFSPTTTSGSTVGVGVNETAYCNLMTDTNAQAACKQDTTYGVAYDTTNHVVTGLARTTNARSTSWNSGAYQFVSGTVTPFLGQPSVISPF